MLINWSLQVQVNFCVCSTQKLSLYFLDDFRSRKVRAQSFEESVGMEQRLHQLSLSQDDDMMDFSDSGQTSPATTPYSPPPVLSMDTRPFSGPVIGSRKFKYVQKLLLQIFREITNNYLICMGFEALHGEISIFWFAVTPCVCLLAR